MYQPDLFGPFQHSPTEAVAAIKADIAAGERDLDTLTRRHGDQLVRYMRRKGFLDTAPAAPGTGERRSRAGGCLLSVASARRGRAER